MVLHALGRGRAGLQGRAAAGAVPGEQSCLPTEQTPITTRTQLVEALAGGMAVLLVEGKRPGVGVFHPDAPGRSVTNPSGEGNMRGPLWGCIYRAPAQ